MTQEDIEKTAEQYAYRQVPVARERNQLSKGFKDGANWRIESVWHSVKDKPIDNKLFLYENAIHCYHTDLTGGYVGENVEWEDFAKDLGLLRWAYVKDLIPNNKY